MPNPDPARAMANPTCTHAVPNPARFRAVALLLPALFACILLSGCGGGWGVAVGSRSKRTAARAFTTEPSTNTTCRARRKRHLRLLLHRNGAARGL